MAISEKEKPRTKNVDNPKKEWKKKRGRTLLGFCVIAFGLGLEYSLIFPSLWFYIHDFIKARHAKVFYGSALSAYSVGSIIGAFTLGRFVDGARRTKLTLSILLTCEIVGNIIYSIDASPYFPLFGRLLSGFGDVANMVMTAEIARSYESALVTQKLSWLVTCFSIGFILAPGTNILFRNINIHIGSFGLYYANIPGLFLAACFCIILVCNLLMVSDLSREYDFKENIQLDEMLPKNFEEFLNTPYQYDSMRLKQQLFHEKVEKIQGVGECNRHKKEKKPFIEQTIHKQRYRNEVFLTEKSELIPSAPFISDSTWNTVRQIVSCPDLVLLLSLAFVASYILFTFDTLMALIASQYFGLSVTSTSLIFIVDGVVYAFVLTILGKVSERCSDYQIILTAFSILFIGLVSIFVLSIDHGNKVLSYVLLVIYIFAFSTTWTIEEVLTRSLFSKLVPSRCQSLAEGFRRSVSCTAFIISGVTSAGLFDYLSYLCSALCFVTVLLLVLFIRRKKIMHTPKPLFH